MSVPVVALRSKVAEVDAVQGGEEVVVEEGREGGIAREAVDEAAFDVGEDEVALGPGHGDVEEAALFVDGDIVLGHFRGQVVGHEVGFA
eukprot:CAMPEP_0197429006 /NCGR_PEP_ID=MMETSP1170-20131217/42703_1 /TAXON_ID=54406 /ORGANISM="Sarcinochrysis sp, Strain CCMP770" /LENGTH=88 /DNA_ID=CAMNT_0042956811 /DNA_START=67 /DNA_END=329 /DNA_ORIENTATION=-